MSDRDVTNAFLRTLGVDPSNPEKMSEALLRQSAIVDPGTTMYVILHTGDEGLVPPSDEEMAAHADSETGWASMGKGSGHAFGPFVSEEEAADWERVADLVRPCGCRKALVPVIVPRILAVIGPAGVPIEAEGTKDWMN